MTATCKSSDIFQEKVTKNDVYTFHLITAELVSIKLRTEISNEILFWAILEPL